MIQRNRKDDKEGPNERRNEIRGEGEWTDDEMEDWVNVWKDVH